MLHKRGFGAHSSLDGRFNSPWLLRTILTATTGMLALASCFALPALAAEDGPAPFIRPGSMAVSGFPGTFIPYLEAGLPPGINPVDEMFIDPSRASLRIFDVSALGGPPSGQLAYVPEPFEVLAGQIGQVFGLTYDDGLRDGQPSGVPNLYAAATSLHGVQIVSPDADGDGRPERLRRGAAGAIFMDGQFAENNGGGPGSIWKIDGLSGAVSLFADIDGNSGPGLGDIAFDPVHRQFFASDLDTGLIHRIGADGALIETFDHGVAGRPTRGLSETADDGAVMDIAGAGFDSEDTGTWGYTQDERRVWAVQVHGGRLFYAVGDDAEIWSVGIDQTGGFAGDPRWELTVAADKALPVTDIAFDNRGFLYLAQRGEIENRYDYSRFADSGDGEVLRYWRESPDDPATPSVWIDAPQEYAVGFPSKYRQSAGGLDLQYGYDSEGHLNTNVCAETLVKTGDRLRDNPAFAEQLAAGGPVAVHGVQITATSLVRPANEPPFGSWFVDYDGFHEDPDVLGHVGDVEVWRPCYGRAGWYDEVPGGFLPPFYPPEFPPPGNFPVCVDVQTVRYFCTPRGGLEADISLVDRAGSGGDSIKAASRTAGASVLTMQPTPPDKAPFTIGIAGHSPGQKVDVGLCFYRKSDADRGGSYPCCKVVVTLQTPAFGCEQ